MTVKTATARNSELVFSVGPCDVCEEVAELSEDGHCAHCIEGLEASSDPVIPRAECHLFEHAISANGTTCHTCTYERDMARWESSPDWIEGVLS